MPYDAFLSYNKNDERIVKNVQSVLERVPKKNTENKKQKLVVFRDKTHLVAGQLTERIKKALWESNFLIVFCSDNAVASNYVYKEIALFWDKFSTNDANGRDNALNHILFVGCENGSKNNKPIIQTLMTKALEGKVKEKELQLIIEKATGNLYADFGSIKGRFRFKETRLEIYKLAGAILDSDLDELWKRAERRRRRIVIGVITVLCVAIVYLLWSNYKIRENYNNSLKEQSKSLAVQSERARAGGDSIGAIEYALQGLPSEKNNRPIVTEAVRALSDSLQLYTMPDEIRYTAYRKFNRTGKPHRKIQIGKRNGNTYLAELYANGELKVWNIETGKEVLTDYIPNLTFDNPELEETEAVLGFRNCAFTDDGLLILVTSGRIIIVDPKTEKEIHNILFNGFYGLNSRSISEEASIFLGEDSNSICEELVITEETLWLPLNGIDAVEYLEVNLNTGDSVYHQYDLSGIQSKLSFFQTGSCISHDGRYLAFFDGLWSQDIAKKSDDVYVIDTVTGECSKVFSMNYVSDIGFAGGDELYIAGFSDKPISEESSMQPDSVIRVGGSDLVYNSTDIRNVEAACISASNGELIWHDKYSERMSGIPRVFYRENTVKGKHVFVITGDSMREYDPDKPGFYEEIETDSYIVYALEGDGNHTFAILKNGDFAIFDRRSNLVVTEPTFKSGIVDWAACEGDFVLLINNYSEGNLEPEIIYYRLRGNDSKWSEIKGPADPDSKWWDMEDAILNKDMQLAGDSFYESYTVSGYSDAIDGLYMAKRSLKDGSNIWLKTIIDNTQGDADTGSDYFYVGIAPDIGKEIFVSPNSDTLNLLYVDLKDGSYEKKSVRLNQFEDENGEKLKYKYYYPAMNHSQPLAGIQKEDDSNSYITLIALFGNEDDYYDEYGFMFYDLKTGDANYYCLGPFESKDFDVDGYMFMDYESSQIGIINDENRLMMPNSPDHNGEPWESSVIDFYISAVGIAPDGTVLMWEDYGTNTRIHVFDSKSGKEIKVLSIGKDIDAGAQLIQCKELYDGNLLLSSGNCAVVVDPKSWAASSVIKDTYIGYDSEKNHFLLGDFTADEFGLAPYRTVQKMIEEGYEALGEN